MKTMKVALLATAALAAVSVSARADETAAIKAQLEALTARMAQLEAAPAAPIGYSLLTITEGSGHCGSWLGQHEPKSTVRWATKQRLLASCQLPMRQPRPHLSGAVSSAPSWPTLIMGMIGGDKETNVNARAFLRVTGKTDTAVGEVGARMSFEANASGVDVDDTWQATEYWGWWAMTPEITFGGGYSGSLGNVGHGFDGSCDPCAGIDWFSAEQRDEDNLTFSANPGDAAQVRLSYASGPLSVAIALEDSDYDGGSGDMGVAGRIGYAGDTFSAQLAGILYEHDDGAASTIMAGRSPQAWALPSAIWLRFQYQPQLVMNQSRAITGTRPPTLALIWPTISAPSSVLAMRITMI